MIGPITISSHSRFFIFLIFFCLPKEVISEPNIGHRDFRFSEVPVVELEKIGTQTGIIEDDQGFTWLAGSNGLARYDGYEAVIYRHDPQNLHSLSYNGITSLLSDRAGRLWIATNQGLNRYNNKTGNFIRYMANDNAEYKLPSSSISAMVEDSHGNIWLGSQNAGLIKINGHNAEFSPTNIKTPPDLDLAKNPICALSLSKNGLIWVGIRKKGLLIFDPETLELKYPKDSTGITKQISINILTEGPSGKVWIGTSNSGLISYNPTTSLIKQYQRESKHAGSLHHNTVWDIFFDQQGLLWVATDDALEYYLPNSDSFRHFERLPGTDIYGKVRAIHQTQSGHLWLGMFPSGTAYLDIDATVFRSFVSDGSGTNSLSHTSVTSLAEDRHGNLWIGTEGGLNYLNTQNNTFKHYHHEEGNPHSLPSDSVLSLYIDHKNILWVGTWKGGWSQFNESEQRFYPAKLKNASSSHMKEEVWEIYEDKNKQLWVGGLYLYDRNLDVFSHYTDIYPNGDRFKSDRVKVMYEDQFNDFWIGTLSGLHRFDRSTGKMQSFSALDSPGSLSDDFILSALEDDEGKLWFGTNGGGVNIYNRDSNSFTSIGASDGLYDDSIAGMVDDHLGGLWFISGSGLIHHTKETNTFELFDHKNGLKADLFHRNAIILSDQNGIVFGGAGGLTIFNPNELAKNTFKPPVVLTGLEIYNKIVTPNTQPDILSQAIHVADSIQLNHQQNVFTIHYAALSYRLSGQNKFSYKLEGFDQDWNQVGHVRRATYTNLYPGNYTFRVKASNNSGLWNEEGARLRISIQPPWWKTTLAYCVYFLLISSLGGLIFYVLIRLRQAKNESTLNTQLREVAEIKDAFLANTSHELRTPLNGIIGLAESIISAPKGVNSEDALHKLQIVVASGKRLSNIINDILDFSKLRNHDITLHKSQVNIYDLSRTVTTLSEPLIHNNISVANYIAKDFPTFLADEQRLEQVLFNIFGNAIKFTQAGEISISASLCDETVQIKIKDTGIGIRSEDYDKIFLPFEQSTSTQKGVIGTGLGLSVSKQLIELHGGGISVESNVNSGSTFTISLPFNRSNSSASVPLKTSLNSNRSASTQSPPAIKNVGTLGVKSDKGKFHHLLIVDDEPVNLMVLNGYLSLDNYIITECPSGSEAIDIINNDSTIDLIILDVMMPGMSGYDVCKTLRKTYKRLELPILFLSAKSQDEDLDKGYQAGANDFLFKPIKKIELLSKIKMHLAIVNEYKKGG